MLIEGFCRDLPGRLEVSRGRTFGFIRRHRWMVRFWHSLDPWASHESRPNRGRFCDSPESGIVPIAIFSALI
jgi:hypothetical protein